jgi:hypothetical protein
MIAQDIKPQRRNAAPLAPDWLPGLIRAVRREGLQPKDDRVKLLWRLVRRRESVGERPWLLAVLRRIWKQGLPAGQRPRTARRLVRCLKRWGVLRPLRIGQTTRRSIPVSPLRPIAVRPLRPVTVRPFRPVTIKPVAQAAAPR